MIHLKIRGENINSRSRILDIYKRLCEGKSINRFDEAEYFGVNERSIQRDIDEIRAFLDERAVSEGDMRHIVYDRTQKGFVMTGNEDGLLDNNEILAVSKILLASRAFMKSEISSILDKIISGCVPHKNMKLVSQLVSNEKYHYVQPKHGAEIMDKLWGLGEHIKNSEYMQLSYFRQGENHENTVSRVVEPLAVIFSEYYFYLLSYTVRAGNMRGLMIFRRYSALTGLSDTDQSESTSIQAIQIGLRRVNSASVCSLCMRES